MIVPRTIATSLSVLFFLLWPSVANEALFALPDPKGPSTGKNHALIIGINDYNNWPKLQSPVKDAEQIAKILTNKYDFKKTNIDLLTDKSKEEPSLVTVLAHLDRYTRSLTDKDNLLIYFSGHSMEDEEGETYWIPKDGKKNTKMTWLKHSDLAKEFFASGDLKAKNVCIITDSVFSAKLVRKKSISLTPYDLRYPEKIREKAMSGSREIISFGDRHWPASKNTDGLGLFTYYVHKALKENQLETIDFENLIFDEEILFPITKVAGTKMLRGRLRKAPMEKGGQFVINKLIPLPIVDIIDANVSPEKGYPGDRFSFSAKTSSPASEVFLEIGGEKHAMTGSGTEWKYIATVDKLGDLPFTITSLNNNAIAGKTGKGRIRTIRKLAEIANVQEALVSPDKGLGGDKFHFTAVTDTSAARVELILKGDRFKMEGAGTKWSLNKVIEDPGSVNFSIMALNEDGVQGSSKKGTFQVKAGPVKIVNVITSPKSGYAGEEFLIKVKTDRPAGSASFQIDGMTYKMEGGGKEWSYKKKIPDIGKKKFIVTAINLEGVAGPSQSGEILTKKSPLPIPDVASVDVDVVSPGKGYAGDKFVIKATTSAPSDKVYVEIDGLKHVMEGADTNWNYLAKIDKIGATKYSVIAKNKDGVQGQSKEGEITTLKQPAKPIRILQAQVSPEKGYKGKEFIFKASTDRPAKNVILAIGKKRYKMSGSDTAWSLRTQIDKTGELEFSIIAINEDDMEGEAKGAAVTVLRSRFKLNDDGTVTDLITGDVKNRFIDNADGTVTDLYTNLMWLKTPKQVAVTWEDAEEYCRNLEYQGHTGWRLPTITEWTRIIDKKQQNPALPPGSPFSNVLTHTGYWSKTKHKFGPLYVYQVNLWNGQSGYQNKKKYANVWPVRYAELPK